jgi:hypothetical protein
LKQTIFSAGWARALPPGPDTRIKITEEYAKLVARQRPASFNLDEVMQKLTVTPAVSDSTAIVVKGSVTSPRLEGIDQGLGPWRPCGGAHARASPAGTRQNECGWTARAPLS